MLVKTSWNQLSPVSRNIGDGGLFHGMKSIDYFGGAVKRFASSVSE